MDSQPIPYAQRRAAEMSGEPLPTTVEEIKERFRSHRSTCEMCGSGSSLCQDGMALAARIEEARRPPISTDAQFIAGKIVKHMWIIFVLLPIVLAILVSLLK